MINNINKELFLFFVMFLLILQSCNKRSADVMNAYGENMSQRAALKMDISTLSADDMEGREIGTPGEKKAAAYISMRMKDIGLSPGVGDSYYQFFEKKIEANPHATGPSEDDHVVKGRNVIGMLDNGSEGYVVIGAHYDHLGYGSTGSLYTGDPAIHNGADDNASGVAMLLDLATKLEGNNMKENYNFIFIAFSGEEKGLWGSNYYSKNATQDMKAVSYMFNMDMVGRLNDEKRLAVNGTGTSPVFDKILDEQNKYGFILVKSESGVGPSDHTSFYLEDVPVLHFFTGQHGDYHRPSDDEEFINYDGVVAISDFLYDMIVDLNDDGDLTFIKTKDESTEAPRFKVTMGVIPDYLFDGKGMRIDGVKEGRPAANAGIEKGDIVTRMGEVEIVDMMSYMKGLSQINEGDRVDVEIKRNGKFLRKKVTF